MQRFLKTSLGTLSFPIRYSMAIYKFHLPDLGEKIKEGTVKAHYVKEGDHVFEFSKISDVESDKQFTEITSPYTGIVYKVNYQEG